MKRRAISILLGVLACFAFSGCLVVDMELGADGAGTMRVEFPTDVLFWVKEKDVTTLFREVEIVSYKPGKIAVIDVAFSDIEQLTELTLWKTFNVAPPEVRRHGDSRAVRVDANALRDWSMRQRLAGEDETQQVLRLRVRTAGDMESSNADEAEGRTATWSYTILDFWNKVAPSLEWAYRADAAQAPPVAGRYGPAKPNIILFVGDDMGLGDVRVYDPRSTIPTANLDRIAAEGIRFSAAYAPSAVCTPSRYSLLTGRYAFRSRLRSPVLYSAYARPILDAEHETIAGLLQRAGYRTAAFGKWHLGMTWSNRAGDGAPAVRPGAFTTDDVDFSKPISDGPLQHGFQSFFGLASSINHDPYSFVENDRLTELPTRQRPEQLHGRAAFRPGWIADSWDDSQQGVVVSGRALDFITRHVAEDAARPFFMYYAATAPHVPHVPPVELHGIPIAGRGGNDNDRPKRNDMIVENDVILGLLLERLEDPNGDGDRSDSIAHNTLVIVTSDNGADFGDAPGLRGLKGGIFEGGLRVPFIARWPRRIPAGVVNEQAVSLVDLYATFAALTGTAQADGTAEDSENVLPAFYGQPIARGPIFLQKTGATETFAVRDGNWKLVVHKGRPLSLYDLGTDSREMQDRATAEPATVARLMREYARVRNRTPASTSPGAGHSKRSLRIAPWRQVG